MPRIVAVETVALGDFVVGRGNPYQRGTALERQRFDDRRAARRALRLDVIMLSVALDFCIESVFDVLTHDA